MSEYLKTGCKAGSSCCAKCASHKPLGSYEATSPQIPIYGILAVGVLWLMHRHRAGK